MLAILTAAAMAAAAAPVQQSSVDGDLRCLVSLVELANLADEKDAGDISTLALYYFGRVDARQPTLDLVAAAKAIREEQGYDIAAEATRCAEEVTARQSRLDDMESSLQPGPAKQ